MLAACNEPAEVAVTVNTLRTGREAVLARLAAAGVEAAPAAGPWPLAVAEQIVLAGRGGATVPELVEAGELTPQSRGSAAVVELLDPQPGEHLLDLCSGPGIKTGQIAARSGDRGETISVELDPDRAAEVAAQARRLGLRSVTVVEADAAEAPMAPGFDRVLVDAPCSGLGVLRRRADARWRIGPDDVVRLAALQRELLDAAVPLLRPGGLLAYSVCTLTTAETVEVDGWLAAAHPELTPRPPPAGPWRPWGRGALLLPQAAGTDGMAFFAWRRGR
jgi:16S rRNA (cytosine967-C5)-methyltransferase